MPRDLGPFLMANMPSPCFFVEQVSLQSCYCLHHLSTKGDPPLVLPEYRLSLKAGSSWEEKTWSGTPTLPRFPRPQTSIHSNPLDQCRALFAPIVYPDQYAVPLERATTCVHASDYMRPDKPVHLAVEYYCLLGSSSVQSTDSTVISDNRSWSRRK